MIREKLTYSANVQLDFLYDGSWLDENSVQERYNGKLPDIVYVRAMPAPKAAPLPVLAPRAFPCKLASCWIYFAPCLSCFPVLAHR